MLLTYISPRFFGAFYEIGEPMKIKSENGSIKREIVLIDSENQKVSVKNLLMIISNIFWLQARATIWNSTDEIFKKNVMGLDDVIVVLGKVRISSFARVGKDRHIDIFDDSIIMVRS